LRSKDNLSLGPDIYSLAMFGYYIHTNEKKMFDVVKKKEEEDKKIADEKNLRS